MVLREIEASMADYEEAFVGFNNAYQLPREWFRIQDHLAIKCADTADYEQTIDEIQRLFQPEGMWEVEMDGRRLASAVLSGGVVISRTVFKWLEIMEPRPGKELDKGFVEHTEFVMPDSFEVMRILHMRGVENVTQQKNPEHSWVNVEIDEDGREIKFNDMPLADVIEHEQDKGICRTILPYKEFEGADVIELRPRREE